MTTGQAQEILALYKKQVRIPNEGDVVSAQAEKEGNYKLAAAALLIGACCCGGHQLAARMEYQSGEMLKRATP